MATLAEWERGEGDRVVPLMQRRKQAKKCPSKRVDGSSHRMASQRADCLHIYRQSYTRLAHTHMHTARLAFMCCCRTCHRDSTSHQQLCTEYLCTPLPSSATASPDEVPVRLFKRFGHAPQASQATSAVCSRCCRLCLRLHSHCRRRHDRRVHHEVRLETSSRRW